MKLDKSKSYGEIIGSTDGSKYDQGGNIFDCDGNQLNVPETTQHEELVDHVKRMGRPPKNDNFGKQRNN